MHFSDVSPSVTETTQTKLWKCDPYHELGSRNPKVARFCEKTWHDSKEGNELGIV